MLKGKYFKFRVAGYDIDRSCVLFLKSGHQKRGTIKYCGGTTNLTNYLKSCVCSMLYNKDKEKVIIGGSSDPKFDKVPSTSPQGISPVHPRPQISDWTIWMATIFVYLASIRIWLRLGS